MSKKIEDLELRANPEKGRVKSKNKKSMEEVIKNGKDLYETRNKIINIL